MQTPCSPLCCLNLKPETSNPKLITGYLLSHRRPPAYARRSDSAEAASSDTVRRAGRPYLTADPGLTPSDGCTILNVPSLSSAIKIIPYDSTPMIFPGASFTN